MTQDEVRAYEKDHQKQPKFNRIAVMMMISQPVNRVFIVKTYYFSCMSLIEHNIT